MHVAPLPVDEADRLAALQGYSILDTKAESIFDDITLLAASICKAPIALISLVDQDRQWFKSVQGLPGVSETPRDIAFCAHALLKPGLMEVPDAMLDERFYDNPLVLNKPKIRFYAGMPLINPEGFAVGTLCVIDCRPRRLSCSQRESLERLSKIVISLLEARKTRHQVDRMGLILEKSFHEIYLFDACSLRFVHVNEGARKNLQYSIGELRELTPLDLKPAFGQEQFAALIEPLRSGEKEQIVYETYHLRKDGSTYPVEVRLQLSRTESAGVFIAVIDDITERKQIKEALFQEKELAAITLQSTGDAVITTDARGLINYLNPVAERLVGCSKDQVIGCLLDEVLNIIDEASRKPIENLSIQLLQKGKLGGSEGQILLLSDTGEEHSIEAMAASIHTHEGQTNGMVLVFHDITQTREMTRRISYQATHDALTDLINRQEFERITESLLDRARVTHKQHGLIYMDLDQFKVVNDTCGHLAGDALLRQLASLLRSKMRKADTLARLGGDEFGILLEGCCPTKAQQVAQSLMETIRDFRFSWQDKFFTVSASMGLVAINRWSKDLKSVLSTADAACYVAKDMGRNRIHLFDEADDQVLQRHGEMNWVSRITQAIEDSRFHLYVQKIIPIQTPTTDGEQRYEVLLRMEDEDGQIVPPMSFIPAVERYNQMPAIDRWVVQTLLEKLRTGSPNKQASSAREYQYAINLSGLSINDPQFLNFTMEQFQLTGLPPEMICFEITETAAIANLNRAIEFIQTLRAMGCHFALDDFGTGMSSFSYLKHLPVDYIKIDGSFVRDIADDPVNYAMVEAINRIGHVMGIKTIAEFVENDAVLTRLSEIGVNYAQGYGVHRPEPLADIEGYVFTATESLSRT